MSLAACRNLEGGPEVSETRTLDAFTRVRIEDGIPAKSVEGIASGGSRVTISGRN